MPRRSIVSPVVSVSFSRRWDARRHECVQEGPQIGNVMRSDEHAGHLANEPAAGIMYHSWEVGPIESQPRDHPVRNIFTPFNTHQPKDAVGDSERDCTTLIHIGFHVDRRTGLITLFPGSEKQMVRAYEILHPPASP